MERFPCCEQVSAVVEERAPGQEMQLRSGGLDNEAARRAGLVEEGLQGRAETGEGVVEREADVANKHRVTVQEVLLRVVTGGVAEAEAAGEVAPLFVGDGRAEVAGRVGLAIDDKEDAEGAFGGEWEAFGGRSAREFDVNNCSFAVKRHGGNATIRPIADGRSGVVCSCLESTS